LIEKRGFARVKGMRMNQTRFAMGVGVVAGIFLLAAAAGVTRAQSSQPGPVQTPHLPSPAVWPKRDTRPTDYFAGLKFTDDQKAKIDEIHQHMKLRTNAVVNDQKLSADQKGAMLAGFRRMENGEVFKLLTPEQQKLVREQIHAQRLAGQAETKKQSPPK
jgi:Spy/CpxP family protein refolding chaperone